MIGLLAVAALLLGVANGANDNFKGVATLYGGGVLGYRASLALATAATFLGSLIAFALGAALLETFRGKGLVPDALSRDPHFLAAVGLGAAATVLVASRLGLPVSTTHALVGALVGAGAVRAGGELHLDRLAAAFVAPLLAGPIVASVLTGGAYPLLQAWRARERGPAADCACVGWEVAMQPTGGVAAVAAPAPALTAHVGSVRECDARYGGRGVAIEAPALLAVVHATSAAAVSFARGVNDTPKIAALLLAAPLLAPEQGVAIAGVAIAAGGLLGARRVAEVMSHRITRLGAGQALSANLATTFLVLVASRLGLPVSTTHVSCGALFGVGAVSGGARAAVVRRIVLAWVATLPAGAAAGAALALGLG